eukprot:TRINITY_DN7611_c0_g2_i1.p1 TRINITY_DN7611_c0_g2~~TRINITY_DN7611_c0_g2_i1.p1  ORF type:complete len:361 (+),score=118.85 TRINITY_DN7611_c0_g2_i1:44-1126(+)
MYKLTASLLLCLVVASVLAIQYDSQVVLTDIEEEAAPDGVKDEIQELKKSIGLDGEEEEAANAKMLATCKNLGDTLSQQLVLYKKLLNESKEILFNATKEVEKLEATAKEASATAAEAKSRQVQQQNEWTETRIKHGRRQDQFKTAIDLIRQFNRVLTMLANEANDHYKRKYSDGSFEAANKERKDKINDLTERIFRAAEKLGVKEVKEFETKIRAKKRRLVASQNEAWSEAQFEAEKKELSALLAEVRGAFERAMEKEAEEHQKSGDASEVEQYDSRTAEKESNRTMAQTRRDLTKARARMEKSDKDVDKYNTLIAQTTKQIENNEKTCQKLTEEHEKRKKLKDERRDLLDKVDKALDK